MVHLGAVDDGWDAMEGSISSDGCRPTVGAMKYGDALAIAKLATQLGEHLGTDTFLDLRNIFGGLPSRWSVSRVPKMAKTRSDSGAIVFGKKRCCNVAAGAV